MGPENQMPQQVCQPVEDWVEAYPDYDAQLLGEEDVDLQAASQFDDLLLWSPELQVDIGLPIQDGNTEQQPTFDQQLFSQTLTNDEFALQWQDMNAAAFDQQSPDNDQSSQTLFDEELFGEQILDLGNPVEPFFNQEPFEHELSVQQTPMQQLSHDHDSFQETLDVIWTQQVNPGPTSIEDVLLQHTFKQQQEQMPVPFSAPRTATGIAPCQFSAPVAPAPNTDSSGELPPGFDMCVKCNEAFEVARNRGTACYFHREPQPVINTRHPFWENWNEAITPDISWLRERIPDAFIWSCCGNHGAFPGCSTAAHKTNGGLVVEVVESVIREQDIAAERSRMFETNASMASVHCG